MTLADEANQSISELPVISHNQSRFGVHPSGFSAVRERAQLIICLHSTEHIFIANTIE